MLFIIDFPGGSVMRFYKKDFYHKKWGIGEIGEGGVLKKEVSLIFILTNPSQCYLSLSVCCVFMFCLLGLMVDL